MDKSKAFMLLELLRSYGQPIGSDDLTVQAWAATLDQGMDFPWARDHARAHFARETTDLRIADFNRAWRERQEIEMTRLAITAPRQEPERTPMPDYVRAQWQRMSERSKP